MLARVVAMETSSRVDASTGNGTELERCFVVDCNHEVIYMCHFATHAELTSMVLLLKFHRPPVLLLFSLLWRRDAAMCRSHVVQESCAVDLSKTRAASLG